MKLSTKLALVGLALHGCGLIFVTTVESMPIAFLFAISLIGGVFLGIAIGMRITDE